MPATPKALRAPPPRRFENYILTRSTAASVSLSNVHDKLFLPCSPADLNTDPSNDDPGVGYEDDGYSVPIHIGFEFEIDGLTYNRFVASTEGWVVLLERNTPTFDPSSVFLIGLAPYLNAYIRPTFTSNSILLAPWFDDLRNVAFDIDQLATIVGPSGISNEKRARVNQGLEPPISLANATKNSVKFFRDVRSPSGRRLIVRWNSLSSFNSSNATTVLRFEAVIYENGKIEFRYSPRANFNNPEPPIVEDATIGIFMPNGTDRWRDFSFGLGYRDTERQQYRYGGAVFDPTYTDHSGVGDPEEAAIANYTCNLQAFTHWPGLGSAGSMFTFAPPVNRRKILPRNEIRRQDNLLTLPTVARTGDNRLGSDAISFDDRRTLTYTTGVLINAPSMMQRFYGDSEPTCVIRQDLFSGDFEFTGSVARSVADQFIQGDVPKYIEPFSEYKLYENDPASATDDFYTSGSSIDALGSGLSQPLKAKTQIRLTMPINNTVRLLGTSATIHYYNSREGAWEVPQNSSYVIDDDATQNPSPLGVPKGDIDIDRGNSTVAVVIPEDHRGFGPIGNSLASGSRNISAFSNQTDESIGSPYTPENVAIALSKSYSKSVTNNEDYRATANEVIKLPINHPFLIERAVIEIPFAAGDGWFADKTECISPIEQFHGCIDFGGPGLTVALFNQTLSGDGLTSRRELIMSGVITHTNDNISEIVFSTFSGSGDNSYQIRPRGYNAFGGAPSTVVLPVGSSPSQTFTGSVAVKCEAQTSNGVILRLEISASSVAATNRQTVTDVFQAPKMSLESTSTANFDKQVTIAYIDNFGRGGAGLDLSGRSVFGKEFITSQIFDKRGQISNPFYVTGTLPQQFTDAIAAGSDFKFEAAVPLQGSRPSPYLVMPNDTLVLAISKSRPVFFGTHFPTSTHTTGSIEHDVQLITGSINVVLYGSLLRENKEFHDTLNQPLASNAIHEIVVGNEYVLDQFNVGYREQFINGFSDDLITGSLAIKSTISGRSTTITTGSRGRVTSKFNARLQPPPASTGYELTTNPSKNFRLQPWYERCNSPRITNHFDDSERYWDTLMPNVATAMAQDGASLFTIAGSGSLMISGNIDFNKTAFVMFDYHDSPIYTQNNNWTKSFPFEPRYASATRQVAIQKSFISKTRYDEAVSVPPGEYTFTTPPTRCDSLIVGFATKVFSYNFFLNYWEIITKRGWYVDANLSTLMTGGMSIEDTSKVLFGFGDLNTCKVSGYGGDSSIPGSENARLGSNNLAEGRDIWYDSDPENPSIGVGPVYGSNHFHFAPVIRGWKYGVKSGIPEFNRATFRTDHYGQFRDMLEQKLYSKFYMLPRPGIPASVSEAAISVKFVDAAGKLTKPENTWSQNLSLEATSSMPYFDGETRNRTDINLNTLNSNIISFNSNQFGQVTL